MSDKIYRDLGTSSSPCSTANAPAEKFYPSVSFPALNFPELKDLDISDKVEITFICRLTSRHESETGSSVCMDLMECAVMNVSKEDETEKKKVTAVIEVKNEADVALEAVIFRKRAF